MDTLRAITQLWLRQIKRARAVKKRQFGDTADRAWRFYGEGDHKFLFSEQDAMFRQSEGRQGFSRPTYPIPVNMVSEYVRMMLPFVHAKNPRRIVLPRRPSMPPEVLQAMMTLSPEMGQAMMQQQSSIAMQDKYRAHLAEWVLNYTPALFDLGGQARPSVTEALVTGLGVVWHGMARGLPLTVFDSQENLLWDPDAEQQIYCSWVARLRTRPAWAVAEDFDIPATELKGSYDAYLQDRTDDDYVANAPDDDDDDEPNESTSGKPGDVVQYWEVYSRMGLGGAFLTADESLRNLNADSLGPHVFLAIMPGMNHPLNLNPRHMHTGVSTEEIMARLRWPVAFYGNEVDPWPCTTLEFLRHPRQVWPTSTLAEALPLQEFLDYQYSALMNRVIVTFRDLVLTSDALDPKIRKAFLSGGALEVVGHNMTNDEIAKYVHIFQWPQVNPDTFRVLQMVEQRFREKTGLTELRYGSSSRQMRSSAEAQIRQQNMSTVPEDMADAVEAWHGRVAAKESIAMRLHVAPKRFAELAGEPYSELAPGPMAMAWGSLMNTEDPYLAADQMCYTVEAGSGRKPNPQKEVANVQNLMQTAMPYAMQQYQTGNPSMLNALWHLWGKANEMDVSFLMAQAPPPPQPQQPTPPQTQQAA